jgi:hypothetical protein
MTAGKHNIEIPRGGKFSEQLSFVATGTSTPINLTGLSPFVAHVRERSRGPLILALTVTDTNLSGGVLTITADAADTEDLRLCNAYWDLLDADGNRYVKGRADIVPIISQLA